VGSPVGIAIPLIRIGEPVVFCNSIPFAVTWGKMLRMPMRISARKWYTQEGEKEREDSGTGKYGLRNLDLGI